MIRSRFARLFQSLANTRKSISGALVKMTSETVSPETIDELESLFLSSDMGIQTTQEILEWLFSRKRKGDIREDLHQYLQSMLTDEIQSDQEEGERPTAIFIIGVNGTGKTTTTAKLAHFLKSENHSVLLIGADTYRAAAIQQLKSWCTIANVDLICNESAKDPSSVVYDGLKAAQARVCKYAIIDTAGRLHTSRNLMNEVEKMYRVAKSKFTDFDLISYLTIDANLGQNSLAQVSKFNEYIPVDGIILTKMDGTAKGGIVFPIYRELRIPVKFIGVGETLDDLVRFNPKEYVLSLMSQSKNSL